MKLASSFRCEAPGTSLVSLMFLPYPVNALPAHPATYALCTPSVHTMHSLLSLTIPPQHVPFLLSPSLPLRHKPLFLSPPPSSHPSPFLNNYSHSATPSHSFYHPLPSLSTATPRTHFPLSVLLYTTSIQSYDFPQLYHTSHRSSSLTPFPLFTLSLSPTNLYHS